MGRGTMTPQNTKQRRLSLYPIYRFGASKINGGRRINYATGLFGSSVKRRRPRRLHAVGATSEASSGVGGRIASSAGSHDTRAVASLLALHVPFNKMLLFCSSTRRESALLRTGRAQRGLGAAASRTREPWAGQGARLLLAAAVAGLQPESRRRVGWCCCGADDELTSSEEAALLLPIVLPQCRWGCAARRSEETAGGSGHTPGVRRHRAWSSGGRCLGWLVGCCGGGGDGRRVVARFWRPSIQYSGLALSLYGGDGPCVPYVPFMPPAARD